jgi:hypothetical protein
LWTHKHTAHKPIKEPKYIIGSYLHYVWSNWKYNINKSFS